MQIGIDIQIVLEQLNEIIQAGMRGGPHPTLRPIEQRHIGRDADPGFGQADRGDDDEGQQKERQQPHEGQRQHGPPPPIEFGPPSGHGSTTALAGCHDNTTRSPRSTAGSVW